MAPLSRDKADSFWKSVVADVSADKHGVNVAGTNQVDRLLKAFLAARVIGYPDVNVGELRDGDGLRCCELREEDQS